MNNHTVQKIKLLLTQLEVKTAQLDLKAKELRAILARHSVTAMTEEEFRAEVSGLLHEIGLMESPEASIWEHYRKHCMHLIENLEA